MRAVKFGTILKSRGPEDTTEQRSSLVSKHRVLTSGSLFKTRLNRGKELSHGGGLDGSDFRLFNPPRSSINAGLSEGQKDMSWRGKIPNSVTAGLSIRGNTNCHPP